MKKAIALLIVIAILAGGFLYVRNVDQQDKQRMRDLYAEVEPLQRQREALIAERDRLETEYTLQMRDVGTVELLFRQLNVSIFTDVYPKMRDLGVIGVLGVNNHEYPGYGYRMSLEQFSRLVKDGWGCCFIYESTSDFDSWYEGMARKLENDGLPVPRAIYFPDNTYSNAINASLIRCGIDTVIRGASDGHSATVTAQNGKLWYTGAMPWNYTGVNADTDLLARTNGANLVFTVSFDNLWDAYDDETFGTALDGLVALRDGRTGQEDASQTPMLQDPTQTGPSGNDPLGPKLKIVTFEEARQSHQLAEANNAVLEKEHRAREAELNQQIDALDQQIRGLYEKWGQTGDKNDAMRHILESGNEQES